MKTTTQPDTHTTTQRTPRQEFVTPTVDILDTKDGYLLKAEMPGVNKDGLEITLEATEMTITGHRTQEAVSGEAILGGGRHADYRRVFELDPAIDTSKVSAKMDQGVLTLVLPKSERVKPRRIVVD